MLAQAYPYREKSPEAFRTISEVSALLDVPQHVLRFWESRFTQVKPVKRAGGRRYYRPEDIDLLRGVRALLYSDGFTIKGVQKVFRDRGARAVAEIGRSEVCNTEPSHDISVAAVALDDFDAPETEPEIEAAEEAPRVVQLRPAPATPVRVIPCNDLFEVLDQKTVAVATPEPASGRLAEGERVKLEILLAELQQLRTKLREAR